jgi:uracil-DNA glycosylase family protein
VTPRSWNAKTEENGRKRKKQKKKEEDRRKRNGKSRSVRGLHGCHESVMPTPSALHRVNLTVSPGVSLGGRPTMRSLAAAEQACQRCQACPLYRHATQAVFGEGPTGARAMLIGEQPGNDEDLAGRPFVGPAGALLDVLLAEAGLDRAKLYVTNAVKHFKFTERGKRRLHEKPSPREVRACNPWLAEEIGVVRPRIIVTLGATAAFALLGPSVRLTRDGGRLLRRDLSALGGGDSVDVLQTFHPAAVLRAPTAARRQELRARLAADLALVGRFAHAPRPRAQENGKKSAKTSAEASVQEGRHGNGRGDDRVAARGAGGSSSAARSRGVSPAARGQATRAR